MIEHIVIISLTIYLVGKEIIWHKKEQKLVEALLIKNMQEVQIPEIKKEIESEPITITDNKKYISEEHLDKLLKDELGTDLYNQVVSDENYGKVG